MKHRLITVAALLSSMAFASTLQAHEPEKHMKDAEKPNCAAMKDMDHDKMDMNDPVMQAMMKQCVDAMHAEDKSHNDDHDKTMEHDAPMKDADKEETAAPDSNHHEDPDESEDKPATEHSH